MPNKLEREMMLSSSGTTDEQALGLLESYDEDAWMRLAQSKRLGSSVKPPQSQFRVVAVVVFDYVEEGGTTTTTRFITGHNGEACCLVNSCCAERAAGPPARHAAPVACSGARTDFTKRFCAHRPRG